MLDHELYVWVSQVIVHIDFLPDVNKVPTKITHLSLLTLVLCSIVSNSLLNMKKLKYFLPGGLNCLWLSSEKMFAKGTSPSPHLRFSFASWSLWGMKLTLFCWDCGIKLKYQARPLLYPSSVWSADLLEAFFESSWWLTHLQLQDDLGWKINGLFLSWMKVYLKTIE